MVCKVIKHENKNYYTFYRFYDIQPNQKMFLWLKKSCQMIPVTCISKPENIPFDMMTPDDKFIFRNENGSTITIAKLSDYSKEFKYITHDGGTRRSEIVVFVTDKQRNNTYGKNKKRIGMTDHQKMVLGNMKDGVEYSAACLDTRPYVMKIRQRIL